MRLASTLIASFALIAIIAWFALVDAPSPEEVCQHITAVTLEEASSSELSDETQTALVTRLEERCVQHKRDKIKLRGKLKYATYARCIVESRSLRQIESC